MAEGEVTTRPLEFDGGELEINYSTSAVGSIRIEMQDENGDTLAGFGLGDYPEMFGDEIEGVARWEGGYRRIKSGGKAREAALPAQGRRRVRVPLPGVAP